MNGGAEDVAPAKGILREIVGKFLVLLVPLLLAGCPVPWVYHQWPDFSGAITRSGKPVADAKLRYSTDNRAVGCNEAPGEAIPPSEDKAFHYYSGEVTSSADGEFYFRGERSFFYVWYIIPGIAEYIADWHLCIETADGQRFQKNVLVGWGGMFGTIPDWAPATVRIVGTCDLSSGENCTTH